MTVSMESMIVHKIMEYQDDFTYAQTALCDSPYNFAEGASRYNEDVNCGDCLNIINTRWWMDHDKNAQRD